MPRDETVEAVSVPRTSVGESCQKPCTVVQGICPDGWRVPTSGSWRNWLLQSFRATLSKAGYYQPLDDYDYPFGIQFVENLSDLVDGVVRRTSELPAFAGHFDDEYPHALPVDRGRGFRQWCVKD